MSNEKIINEIKNTIRELSLLYLKGFRYQVGLDKINKSSEPDKSINTKLYTANFYISKEECTVDISLKQNALS